ncbi:MAG: alpha/beta fold hydrolase [Phycisphaeraceae bacterium]|nr:alpha/beta fold hydrolase [Phycisphaeraceae bacterium]
MKRNESWTLQGADGQVIYGNTNRPAGGRALATLVICHGFKGYKDYGFFPYLAEAAAAAGLIAHRFNFSHSGMTNQLDTFERPDLFERDTWGRQITDLQIVIEQRAAVDQLPIVLFGHSRGGDSVLLTAAGMSDRLAGIVTAAAPDTTCPLGEDQKAVLRREGRMASPSSRTGQMLYVGREWLDEMEADPRRFDLLRAIAAIECPKLLIHGRADETVPVSAVHHLSKAGGPNTELLILPGGHTFNCRNPHPQDDPLPGATQQMIEATVNFALSVSG